MKDFTDWNGETKLEPRDREIPTLEMAIDPIRLRKDLRFLSRSPWQWGELGNIRIEILRCHKGRCTFEVALGTTTGVHTLIGKVYAMDVSDIFQAMERINQAGFGPMAEFSIPEPMAYLAASRLLVQEKVEGRLAKEIFLAASDNERAVVSERCARWLARFQAVVPKAGPVFDVNEYLRFLEQCSRPVACSADPLAGKVARLFDRLELAAQTLHRVERCACHGDYGPIQVILAKDRTATCDWDRHGVADPHCDVARFLVQLERLALKRFGSIRALDAASEVFLKTYNSLGGPRIELNLQFYKAANHLKWTTEKIAKPHWRKGIEVALDQSVRALETII